MDEYKAPYLALLRACEEAIKAIEECNYGHARQALIRGDQQAEELYIKPGEVE